MVAVSTGSWRTTKAEICVSLSYLLEEETPLLPAGSPPPPFPNQQGSRFSDIKSLSMVGVDMRVATETSPVIIPQNCTLKPCWKSKAKSREV